MLKDPVCGMDVEEGSEFHSEYQAEHYEFCSAHCVIKFEKNPEQYIKTVKKKQQK